MAVENNSRFKINPEQREFFENAQDRIKQKKRLTRHFVVFMAASILFIVLNLLLGFGKNFTPFNTDWFVWAILIWFFFFVIHFINVMLINRLMGKEWERRQLERLVEKQINKITALQKKVEKTHPLPPQENDELDGPLSPKKPLK